MTVLLEAAGVEKTYGEGALAVRVLRGIDLSVEAGELALLMGPSGSGKTTLLSILAGLVRPSAGAVALCGVPFEGLSEAKMARVRREKLGFVFQNYNLFPALTASENVELVYKMKGVSPERARVLAREGLERVGLGHRVEQLPSELSSGQKQRVAIARALALDPPLVIGDEVTAALDTESAMEVMALLRARTSPSSAVLLVTHDSRLERFADRVVGIEDGRVVRNERLAAGAPS